MQLISYFSSSILVTAQPFLALAKNNGYSNISSFASKVQNKSNISFSTSFILALGLSALLIITIVFNPYFKAFSKTNFVYVIGPSAAQTTKATPSTISIILSTSPPKS